MNILDKSSMILLKLGKGETYKRAKEEYINITRRCLLEEKSISMYFEGVLEGGNHDATFLKFIPNFGKRNLAKGLVKNRLIVWPVLGLSKDKDENIMMIQLKGSAQFNEIDACLMSVVSRVIAGSLYKLRAERTAGEQM